MLEQFHYLIRGFIIGFFVATPMGPVCILNLKRTLVKGRLCGLISGVGAALGDTFYASLAAFGVGLVTHFLTEKIFLFKLFAAAFLITLGLIIFLDKKNKAKFYSNPQNDTSYLKIFFSAFFLDLSNPMSLLIYLAVFSGFGVFQTSHHLAMSCFLVLGIFLGALFWWFLLSQIVGYKFSNLKEASLQKVSKFAGAILCTFGICLALVTFFPITILGKKL